MRLRCAIKVKERICWMSMSGHTLGEKIRNEDLRKCKCRSSLESDEREPSKMTLA